MKKNYLKTRIKSFKPAFQGLKTTFKEQPNFKIHVFAAAAVISLSLILKADKTEVLFLAIMISLVLISELFNSALEYLADFVSHKKRKLIKKAKDTAAAAVLISAVCAFIAGCIIFIPYIADIFN
jgi:diacylglycerol kinase